MTASHRRSAPAARIRARSGNSDGAKRYLNPEPRLSSAQEPRKAAAELLFAQIICKAQQRPAGIRIAAAPWGQAAARRRRAPTRRRRPPAALRQERAVAQRAAQRAAVPLQQQQQTPARRQQRQQARSHETVSDWRARGTCFLLLLCQRAALLCCCSAAAPHPSINAAQRQQQRPSRQRAAGDR